jgi:hypothetical protein
LNLRQIAFGVHVHTCEEQDAQAIAHVVLAGGSGAQDRRHNDAIVLRLESAGWRIALPPKFGQAK